MTSDLYICSQHHDEVAKDILRRRGVRAPPGLNYMEIDTREGQDYLKDMEWCQGYAMRNRAFMRDIMIDVVNTVSLNNQTLANRIMEHCYFQFSMHRDGRTVQKGVMCA